MAAGLLNLAYTALVLLTAVAGLAFVFVATGDDDGIHWTGVLIALVVGLFLLAMAGDLAA